MHGAQFMTFLTTVEGGGLNVTLEHRASYINALLRRSEMSKIVLRNL